MSDPFASLSGGLSSPARAQFAITPDDSADLATFPRVVVANTDGIYDFEAIDGGRVAWNVYAGQVVVVRPRRVFETTTAQMIGLL